MRTLSVLAVVFGFVSCTSHASKTVAPSSSASAAASTSPSYDAALRLLEQERYEEAAAAFAEVVATEPDNALAWHRYGFSLHLAGELERALEIHQKVATFPETRIVGLYNCACACALLGREDEAFDWLAKAFAEGFDAPDQIATDSDLDSLRDDPRFARYSAE